MSTDMDPVARVEILRLARRADMNRQPRLAGKLYAIAGNMNDDPRYDMVIPRSNDYECGMMLADKLPID